ncbi:transposable element Tc1 transposase [Trichonephila clavipes]|nr:transposable element Tc1 transposase [Trichonephila clavipes]
MPLLTRSWTKRHMLVYLAFGDKLNLLYANSEVYARIDRYAHLSRTLAHCRARLQWYLARSGWNHAGWGRIVFSNESGFQLCPDDHQRRVWRRPWKRADPSFTISRHTSPQPGVMVWGLISFDSCVPLVVIRGAFTAQRYVDNIQITALLPFLLQYPGLIFQQDNDSPYTARVAMNCLTASTSLTNNIA